MVVITFSSDSISKQTDINNMLIYNQYFRKEFSTLLTSVSKKMKRLNKALMEITATALCWRSYQGTKKMEVDTATSVNDLDTKGGLCFCHDILLKSGKENVELFLSIKKNNSSVSIFFFCNFFALPKSKGMLHSKIGRPSIITDDLIKAIEVKIIELDAADELPTPKQLKA
jgi:hypothetical protein